MLRRARAAGVKRGIPTGVPPDDLLDDATVLCIGRGGSYFALSSAVGERVGLIGASSVETARRYLEARDIDGVIVGDGLGQRVVDAFLAGLAEDARLRDLPVGVLNDGANDHEGLPNLIRVAGDPSRLVEHVLPFVRLQAFAGRLERVLKSLESGGVVDPDTGLFVPFEACAAAFRGNANANSVRLRVTSTAPTADVIADTQATLDPLAATLDRDHPPPMPGAAAIPRRVVAISSQDGITGPCISPAPSTRAVSSREGLT